MRAFKIIIPKSQNLKIAKQLAKTVRAGDVYGLVGQLGAGKTTFVKRLVQALGGKHKVLSPTFTLLHNYGLNTGQYISNIHHADLYRINSLKEAKATGIQEIFLDSHGASFVEWADKFPAFLPKHTQWLIFKDDE